MRKATLDPVPQIILSIPHEDGKDFIILKVLSGQETPYYYYADGNRIAYVRVGNESVPADAATLKRLVLHGSGISYDSLPTHFKTVDYAFTNRPAPQSGSRTVFRKCIYTCPACR